MKFHGITRSNPSKALLSLLQSPTSEWLHASHPTSSLIVPPRRCIGSCPERERKSGSKCWIAGSGRCEIKEGDQKWMAGIKGVCMIPHFTPTQRNLPSPSDELPCRPSHCSTVFRLQQIVWYMAPSITCWHTDAVDDGWYMWYRCSPTATILR